MENFELELDDNDSVEYKVEAIYNNKIYVKESDSCHLPGFHYLVSWKDYLKEENTWELVSAVQYLWRFVTNFHKEYSEKSIMISLPIDFTLIMAKPTIRPKTSIKQKYGWPNKVHNTSKSANKSWAFDFYLIFNLISMIGKSSTSVRWSSSINWFSSSSLTIICKILIFYSFFGFFS